MNKIAIYGFEGMSLFHLSVPGAIFSDAFTLDNSPFNVMHCTDKPGQLLTSCGVPIIIEHSVETMGDADILLFPSWDPTRQPSTVLLDTIKAAHQRGKVIAGLCLGAFILAHAGLLNHKRATTHWAYGDQLKSAFPQLNYLEDPLYIQEDNLITSAGTAAAIDCCLNMLKTLCGAKTANHISRMMVSAPLRSGGQKQFLAKPIPQSSSDMRINHLVDTILQDVSMPCSLEVAAQRCNMSPRSFSRHFQYHFAMSFNQWLTQTRLNFSQELLESTLLSIAQVAEKSGFTTEQNFRKQFKTVYSISPNSWRKQFHHSLK